MDSDADMPHQALPSTDISTGIGAIPLVPTETIANSQNDQEDSATLSNQIQHNTAFNPHSEQALPSGSSFTASSGDGKLNKAHHQELNDAKLDGQDGTISASNNAFGNNSPSTKTPAIPTVSPQDAASHESELKGTDADSGRSPDIRSSRRRKRPESMPSSPGSRMKKHLKVDSSDSPRLALSPQIIVVDDEEEATYSESFREAARAVAGLRRQLFEHSGQFVDGPITVKTLGSIEWKNNAYWTSDKLYPVGYQSLVVVDKIGWQCHIDRGAEGPSFQITLIKAVPAIVFAESLPNTAWQRAMEFLNAASSSDKEQWQEEFPKTLPLSHNEDGFGLSRPLICQMIEGLDHVEACIGYVMWDERNGTTLDDLITTKSNLTQQLTTGNARGPKLLKKMEELRQRRRMRLKEAGSSSFESPAMKTRNHESKKAELLEFIEKEQTVRHKRAQILAQDKATRAILASVKSRLASAMKKTAIKTLPKSNSEVKWTRVTPLELFPTEIQRDVLWCWDFLGQYADVLRFRTVVPLPHFCHALALQDKTAPQGDSVMEESSHGRLLATLHFHLLEALLVEFTPYLQMSVTDFKKARPLNLMTWPEVARQMFMVAWDVDNGDVDGNAIRILKGGKTSSDQSILSLRDSLDKRGQALLNNKTAETSPPKIKDYGFGMIVTCDTWDGLGLELAVVDGCVQVQKIKNASHPIIRSRVAAGDVLVCLNGVHVAHMPINELNKYASSAEKPLGLIFSRGDRLVTTKQKSHTPVLTRYANVLKILRAKEASAPFNAPVDASMYPDYYRLVPEPMDLATIEDKLLNDEYDDKDLFIEDVELVWRNCFAYNGEDAPISASARKLAATFSRLVDNYLTSANPFNDEDACRRCCTQYCKDRILLCDRCDGSFHMLCLRPPLDEVPQGEWYCPTCVPFQSEKTGDPDDEDFDGEDSAIGIPQIIRLLSKENYMELTLNERVVVFKGLCELVQMCSSVQSVVLSMEDLAEDQRRELGYSFADALREWNSFGEIDETKFEDKNSTESFVENGVTHPLTDTLLMYLKARTEAELNQDVLPSPFFDNDGPIVSDEVAIIEDDNDDIEATLLEEYGDIQLACRKETNSTTDNPQCFCCQMDKLLFADAELIPAVLAPRTSQIAAHMAKLPDIITEPLVTFVCSDAALPFKCEMDENGHAMITHVEPQCDLEVGGIVLALNSIILDEDSDIKQVMQEAKRPIVVLASKSPSTSVDSKEVYLIQLPSTLVDFPNVAFVSSFCQVQPPCTGFVALCDSIFAYDIIFAIDGTRVVNAEDFQKLWQPNALLCVMRNILDRGISKPPLAQEHYSDIQMELWKIKSFQVSFQAGPLGLALDLEENCVVVRSLTPVSQAIRKVQPDDIILTFNDKSIGKLDDLTEFTDTVRTAPRPATIRFYRSSMALTPPSPTDVLMSVGQILQTSLIEFDGRLIVCGEKNHSFSPGDILTHLNDISIEGVSLSWLHQTLEVLPSKDNMYVRVRPKTDPDVPIMAHEHCISIWNTAVIKGTALQRKLVASSELEEQLKEIAPRTWPLSSNYFRFPGDPNTLYKHDDRSWWSTHQIAALVNSENAKIAEKLYAAFFTPPKMPTAGPLAIRPLYTIAPLNQHEAFVIFRGRHFYLGTFSSASEAQATYDECVQRYTTTRLLLAPYSVATFPRAPLPLLKADDILKRFRNLESTPLSSELKELVKYNVRAYRPKPEPPKAIVIATPPKKRQYDEEAAKRGQLSLSDHFERLKDMKVSITEAWVSVQNAQDAPSCMLLTEVLQTTLNSLNLLAQHIAKYPLQSKSPATFVSLHHAIVMCLLSILASEALSKASPIPRPDLEFMHKCGDNLLWAIEDTLNPTLHEQVISNCMKLAENLGEIKTSGLSADMQQMVITMDLFFKSSNYVSDPANYPLCRPLFAMLSHATQPRQVQPLPPTLTQELWKLQTCQGNFERALKRLKVQWPPYLHVITPSNITQPKPDVTISTSATGQTEATVSFQAGPLGIIIQQDDNGIIVSSFAGGNEGQAIRSGKIAVGDMIIAVNGEPLSQIGIDGFKKAVTSGIRPIKITFCRPQDMSKPLKPTPTKEKTPKKRPNPKQTPPKPITTPQTQAMTGNTPDEPITQTPTPLKQATNELNMFDSMVASSPSTNSLGFFSRSLLDPDIDIAPFPQSSSQLTSSMSTMMYDQYTRSAPIHQETIWSAQQPEQMYQNQAMDYPNAYANNMQMLPPVYSSYDPRLNQPGMMQTMNTTNNQLPDITQDFQGFFDPQYYNGPEAFRSGPPIEFVSASPNKSSVASSQDEAKKPTQTEKANVTGRRSTRVSKKPDMIISQPVRVATPSVYIPGAGVQGDFASDALPYSKPPKAFSHAFAILQAQLLAIEAALPREAFRNNKWTRAIRVGWADMVIQAATSRTLMEAILFLEAQIESEYFDAWWKSQSMLGPKTLLSIATIASTAMRLYALDDALNYAKLSKRSTGYKRKLNRRPNDDYIIPPCPQLFDPTIQRIAIDKVRIALISTPQQVCPKTLNELCRLTNLPRGVLEQWYKQCLDPKGAPASQPPPRRQISVASSSEMEAQSGEPNSKRQKRTRGRPPKNLEYRFEPQTLAISPAILKDPLVKDRFLAVVETLKKYDIAQPFLQPVDPVQFPDYANLVRQPMDLGTLTQQIKAGEFNDRLHAIPVEMSRIWTNCFAFNGPTPEISKMARQLRSIFYRLMELWVQKTPMGTRVEDLPRATLCRKCHQDVPKDTRAVCTSCDAAIHLSCIGEVSSPWHCDRCVQNRELK